jgi:eukaryotic-like serine/threonine-protein kinase
VDVLVALGQHGSYTFEPRRPFARGRVSDFYTATRESKRTRLCIKLFDSAPDDPGQSWETELDALQRLAHPNVLQLIDYGSVRFGDRLLPFLVLPYCEGGDLLDLLAGHQFMPLQEALPLLAQVAAALDYAHERGIVHGDVKPENVLLDGSREHAYLADFGVARHFDFVDRVSTASAEIPGTSDYQAPEQIELSRTTPDSDIYAFGLMACRVLTGRLPFPTQSTPSHRMFAKVRGELLDPQELLPGLDESVARALCWSLESRPDLRPRRAGDLIRALETGKTPRSRRGTVPSLWKRLSLGERATLVIGALGALATIIATIVTLLNR